jgi:hypothetical protein
MRELGRLSFRRFFECNRPLTVMARGTLAPPGFNS